MKNVDAILLSRYGIVQRPRSKEETITVDAPRTLAPDDARDMLEFADFIVAERFGAGK